MAARFATTDRRRVAAVLGGLTACSIVGVGYLLVADPHDPAVPMPTCPTKLVTGLDCPACGGLRMTRSLLTGDWLRAVRDNAYLLVALPTGIALLAAWAFHAWRGERRRTPRWVAVAFLGTAAAWAVVRNLPGWPLRPT